MFNSLQLHGHCSTSDFPVLYCLVVFDQIHIHWVDDEYHTSHIIVCHSLLLLPSIFPSIRVFYFHLLSVFWSWWCVCVWACVFWGYDYFSVLARHHELCLRMWPSQMFHTSFKCRDDFSMCFYFSTRHRGISLLFSLVFLLNADGFHWYPLAQSREFCCFSLWLLLKVLNRLFTVQKPIKKQGWWEGKLALF